MLLGGGGTRQGQSPEGRDESAALTEPRQPPLLNFFSPGPGTNGQDLRQMTHDFVIQCAPLVQLLDIKELAGLPIRLRCSKQKMISVPMHRMAIMRDDLSSGRPC